MATHSSILAWETPRMEEPGRLVRGVAKSRTRLSDFSFSAKAYLYSLFPIHKFPDLLGQIYFRDFVFHSRSRHSPETITFNDRSEDLEKS